MLTSYFLIALSSCLVGIIFIALLERFVLKTKVLIHRDMPLVGGLSMWLSFSLVCLFIFLRPGTLSRETLGIILTSAIMLVFGIIDDLRELSIPAKFLVEIIATSALILFGIRTRIVYIGSPFNIIITFIWVLGITNAINHLDIIDGLAGGTAAIASSAFFIICIINNDVALAVLALTLTGAIISFLIYNFPPAKIYMGNSGSHFLGFVLAAIALAISYAPLQRKIALLSPLFILGFPIFDTAFLILMRMLKKNLPFKKSNDHLALRFLALGYSKKKALLAMLVLSLYFSLCGVVLSQVPNIFGAVITVFSVLISLGLINKMHRVAAND